MKKRKPHYSGPNDKFQDSMKKKKGTHKVT